MKFFTGSGTFGAFALVKTNLAFVFCHSCATCVVPKQTFYWPLIHSVQGESMSLNCLTCRTKHRDEPKIKLFAPNRTETPGYHFSCIVATKSEWCSQLCTSGAQSGLLMRPASAMDTTEKRSLWLRLSFWRHLCPKQVVELQQKKEKKRIKGTNRKVTYVMCSSLFRRTCFMFKAK